MNFSRLERLRHGYGYININDRTKGVLAPKDDGVWLIDISKNNKKLLYSLNFLSKYKPLNSMKNTEHYINHISFNPKGVFISSLIKKLFPEHLPQT